MCWSRQYWLAFAEVSLALLALGVPAFPQCAVSEKDTDQDGKADEVTIENEWHQITFHPLSGGRARSWIYKPLGKQLTTTAEDRGVFTDEIAEIATEGTRYALRHAYACELVQKTPQAIVLRLYAPLPLMRSKPEYHAVEVRRTYTLRAGSPLIDVGIEVLNGSDKALPLTLLAQHWVWVEGEAAYYYCPDALGVLMDIDEVTPHGSHPVGSQEPAAGWTGYISKTSRLGLAFIMEWRYLDAIEDWLSSRPSSAVQWPYLQQEIPAGKTWTTRYVIYPLVTMDALDGATEQVAVGVTVGEASGLGKNLAEEEFKVGAKLPVKVGVTGPAARKVAVDATARLLPDESPTVKLGVQDIEIKPGAASNCRFDYSAAAAGTHVITVTVREGTKVLTTVERPFNVGETDQVYFAPRPKEEKIGAPNLGRQIIDPPLPDYCFRFDRSWTTPHVPWGRPHCRGTVRVLFVSRDHYSVSHWREIVERGDMDFDHTIVAHAAGGNPLPYRKNLIWDLMNRLNRRSQDVVFFAGLNWQQGFPPDLKKPLFTQIRKGLGIVVLANPKAEPNDAIFGDLAKFVAEGREVDSSVLTDGMPFGHAAIRAWEVGEGRVAILAGGPGYYEAVASTGSLGEWDPKEFTPHVPGWEYGYGLFVKAIAWAARRESPVVVRKVEPTEKEIRLTVENLSAAPVFATARATVFNRFYERQAEPRTSAEIRPGKNVLYFPIGADLAGGKHLADVILRDPAGGSLGWGSAAFDVPSQIAATVKMDRETSGYRPGEPIQAVVTLQNRLKRPVAPCLRLKAIDALGREAWRAQRIVRMEDPEARTTFDIQGLRRVTVLHDLHLEVLLGDRKVAADRHTFFVFHDRQPVYDDFQIGVYGGMSRDPLREQSTWRVLRQLGIDEFYAYGDGRIFRDMAYRHGFFMVTRQNAAYDLRPRSGPVKSTVDTDNFVVTPSLSDPEVFAQAEAAMKAHAKAASDWSGIDIHLLGDEWMWGVEFDYHPDNLGRFRDWLKSRYPSLDALNRQWGTTFATWETIMPVKGPEVRKAAAFDNLSSWYDFRHYMMGVWTEYVRRPYEAAQSGNPRAEVGHEGVYASGIQVGSDFWQFAPYCRVTGRYNSILEEWYRSVNPEIIHGQYGGYGVDQITPGIRFFPWRTLFHGGHWVFYYMLWDQAQPYQMIIDFDGSPHGGYPALSREEWADIKSGIGKLFIETRFTDDAIALPYSVASIYCGEMCGVGHRGSLYTHKGIIQELGYQHTSVSTEQIAEGELLRRGFRLLFLPATICLSDKAIAAVSEFVGKGGVVVADYAAGVRDEHGKRRSSVPLDDLFGIDRSAATEPTRSLELSFGPSAPEPTRPLRAAMRPGESGLKAAKGQAWAQFEDGTAALVVRKHNDGYAVYTNIDLSAYGSSKGAGVRGEVIVETRGAEDYVKAVQAVFRQIFDLAKTPRRVTVLRDGKPFDHGETFYHTDATGQPLYVGLMMDVPESQAVEVRFHRPSHIYDVRDGIYLGRTDHFTDEFHPGRVQVYAALPYEVTGVTLAVDRPGPEAAFAPGSDVTVRAQVRAGSGQPLLHVFRIEVFRPDGQPDGAYTANHRAEAGALKWTIPMAYNAAPGTWKVVARDIVSGQRASVSFEVTP